MIQMERASFFVGSLWNIDLKGAFEYLSVIIKIYKYFSIPPGTSVLLKEIKLHRFNQAHFLKGEKGEFRVPHIEFTGHQRSVLGGNQATSMLFFSPRFCS